MLLKLKKLRFQNIGRFITKQEIDFESLGLLVQADGKNLNTGGSSGAAKTTIFNALDYLLGLNDIPNTVLQSRLTKDAIFVEGDWEYDGLPLIITREKGKLAINLNGTVVTGSNKITEEKLDEILGMSRSLFRQCLHKRQKEGGFFLQLTPKETHQFLIDCLGLGDIHQKELIVDAKIKEIDKKILDATLTQKTYEVSVENAKLSLNAIGTRPASPITKEYVLEQKTKHEAALLVATGLKEQHAKERADLEATRPKATFQAFDDSTLVYLQEQRSKIDKEISNLRSIREKYLFDTKLEISSLEDKKRQANDSIQKSQKANAEILRIANEIKKIRACTCPTCEQTWNNEASKAQDALLMQKMMNLRSEVLDEVVLNADIESIKVSIAKLEITIKNTPHPEDGPLREQLAHAGKLIEEEKARGARFLGEQSSRHNSDLQVFTDRLHQLEARHEADGSLIFGEAGFAATLFNNAVSQYKAHQEAVTRHDGILEQLQKQIANTEANLVLANEVLVNLAQENLILLEIKKALKSYASTKFDDALVSISDKATSIIRSIPNMANATIQLEGLKETKEGKIKEEVNAVIHSDGEESIPLKSLSGGERSAVDLAVDLSVIDFIESQSNKGADLFILDEPFTGLDSTCIEMTLEVLKNSNINKRLILVDHNEIIKSMVDASITVIRDGETSNIQMGSQ